MRRTSLLGAVLVALVSTTMLVACQPPTVVTFTVDAEASDTVDADPGDGVCANSAGRCSLIAALDESAVGDDDTIHRIFVPADYQADGGAELDADNDIDVYGGQVEILGPPPAAGGPAYLYLAAGFDVHEGHLRLEDVRLREGDAGVRVRAGASADVNRVVVEQFVTGVAVEAGASAAVTQATFADTSTAVSNDGTASMLYSTVVGAPLEPPFTGSQPIDVGASVIDRPSCQYGLVRSAGYNRGCDIWTYGTPTDGLLPPDGYHRDGSLVVPKPGGPLRDAVPSGALACGSGAVDQRHHPRPAFGACDVGAIEADFTIPPTVTADTRSLVQTSGPVTVGVLGNDDDPDTDYGDHLTLAIDASGILGTASTDGTSITYDPAGAFDLAGGETVDEIIPYTVSDLGGNVVPSTLKITITSQYPAVGVTLDVDHGASTVALPVCAGAACPTVTLDAATVHTIDADVDVEFGGYAATWATTRPDTGVPIGGALLNGADGLRLPPQSLPAMGLYEVTLTVTPPVGPAVVRSFRIDYQGAACSPAQHDADQAGGPLVAAVSASPAAAVAGQPVTVGVSGLVGEHWAWYADRPVPLGTGDSLTTSSLAQGDHTIGFTYAQRAGCTVVANAVSETRPVFIQDPTIDLSVFATDSSGEPWELGRCAAQPASCYIQIDDGFLEAVLADARGYGQLTYDWQILNTYGAVQASSLWPSASGRALFPAMALPDDGFGAVYLRLTVTPEHGNPAMAWINVSAQPGSCDVATWLPLTPPPTFEVTAPTAAAAGDPVTLSVAGPTNDKVWMYVDGELVSEGASAFTTSTLTPGTHELRFEAAYFNESGTCGKGIPADVVRTITIT